MNSSIKLDTQRPLDMLRHCPEYQPTPLLEFTSNSGQRLLIKDETRRFNLGAFKALGGIYAVSAFLQDSWQLEFDTALDPSQLMEQKLRDWSGQFTFVCASAGNHGLAVAKGAQLFNARSRVYLADTVSEAFAVRLRNLGAEVVRAGNTYEQSMLAAQEYCETQGEQVVLLADSSWPGYSKMPTRVMEGYTVMAEEMRQTFEASDAWPSYVFLQAGVGGLAAAIAYHIRHKWTVQPQIIVVEPDAAPCLYASNHAGKPMIVDGPTSSMGRLDCKEPSMLAFEILQQCADKYVQISDSDADLGVSFLADNNIHSTPSGAAGMTAILLASKLGIALKETSNAVCIATEGPV